MINFEKVSKSYQNKSILDNFDLNIQNGDKKLIYGDSGSGKTTILRLILGFVEPEDGKVFFDDKQINPNTIKDIRHKIAYVPQNLDIVEGCVLDFIEWIFSLKSAPNLDKDKLLVMMNDWSLNDDILENNFEQLSGGEKQRLAIVIALMLERKIYLLDEPTSSLDEKLKLKTRNLFSNMADTTVIVVSHDAIWRETNFEIVEMGDE